MEYFGLFGVLGNCGFCCCQMMMHNRDYEKRKRQEAQKSELSKATDHQNQKSHSSSNIPIVEVHGNNQAHQVQVQQPISVISYNLGVHSANCHLQIPEGNEDFPPSYSEAIK